MISHNGSMLSYDWFFIVQPPTEWDGGVGFVTKGMVEEHCPAPAADVQVQICFKKRPTSIVIDSLSLKFNIVLFCVQILRCGPPPMNKAIAGHCEALGFTKEMTFQF